MVETHPFRIKLIEKEISEIKKDRELIIEMRSDIKRILEKLADMEESGKDRDCRIEKLEKEKGLNAIKYWQIVITSLLTGAVGYFIAQILN